MAVVLVVSGCGSKESPEDRVTRLRLQYEVEPDGFQPRVTAQGAPELVLSVRVVNKGKESLDALTLLVRVKSPAGEDREVRRVTLDTRGLRPGVSAQLSGVVTGLEFREGDSLLLEREINPPVDQRYLYPEYAAGS
ncbi:MAG: hypothetical protein HRF46_11035 [Acidobacteriota bacterium]